MNKFTVCLGAIGITLVAQQICADPVGAATLGFLEPVGGISRVVKALTTVTPSQIAGTHLRITVQFAPAAQGADADTLLRAAYCIGVLKSQLKGIGSAEHRAALKKNCEKWSVLCVTAEQVWQEYDNKRRRYVAYVLIRTGQRPSQSISALIAKGEADDGLDAGRSELPGFTP